MASSAPTNLLPGDYAPWFHAAALSGSPSYAFSTVAGRHVLMLFFGSAAPELSQAALAAVQRHRDLLDDRRACFFGVTVEPEDERQQRIAQELPGIRFFLDYDRQVSLLYTAAAGEKYRPHWVLLDPSLRIIARFDIDQGDEAFAHLCSELARPQVDIFAPVVRVPDVLERDICRQLINYYERGDPTASGFMREVDGKTVGIHDAKMKQRKDCVIADDALRKAVVARIIRRVAPAIQRSFQFEASRIERHIVACYQAGAGHFRPHRDNTTRGTAHRKFAVTINLNAEEYEGGDLRFPEFGDRTYRAPTGGAIVFSCSLLHEALPVTRGRRYATLPFLYDEAGAKIREENSKYLESGTTYKAAG